mgnify:CR=1 FL=1
MSTSIIYAQRGPQLTIFSAMIWRNMGKDKNGWKPVTKEAYDALVASKLDPTKKASRAFTDVPEEVVKESEYQQLIAQGKGFEADGKLEDAKARFIKAYDLKNTPAIKGRITKLTKAIAKVEADAARAELVEAGDLAAQAGNYEDAVEAYESAQAMKETNDIEEKIKRAQNDQADALVK